MIFWHHPTFFTDRKKTERVLSISKCKKRKIQGNGNEFKMEWEYYKNRILDENFKCDLPDVMPNVEIEKDISGLPKKSVERAHELNDLEPTDKLPF